MIFQKSKRPQTHLLISFSRIRNMVGYIFESPKINLWHNWWCLLGVSSQSFVIFTLYTLLVNGKSFFRSYKHLRLIYLYASVASEIWLVKYSYHQKSTCTVTGDVCLMFPAKALLYSFSTWYWWMENHFQKSKIHQTHLLMVFNSFSIMAGYVF